MSLYQPKMALSLDPTLDDDHVAGYVSKLNIGAEDDDNILQNTAQLLGITAASAVTSLYNGVVGLGNLGYNALGGEGSIDPLSTESLIFDDWADDYNRSKSSYDVAGEVVGSLVPGLGAVKMAKWASKSGRGFARFFDDSYYMAKQNRAYREVIRSVKSTDSWQKAEYVNKTLAIGATRGAVEGAVYELAAYTTQNLATDLNRDDLSALDMLGHIGVRVLYGSGFNAVGGAIGSYVSRVTPIAGRLEAKGIQKHVEVDSLLKSAPLGSQVSKFRNNIEELTGEIDNGSILKKHTATQLNDIDNTLSNMLAGGTEHYMFEPLSRYAKSEDIEKVETLFTGTERFMTMMPTTEQNLKTIPDRVKRWMDENDIVSGVGHDSPLTTLKNMADDEEANFLMPPVVKSWALHADPADYEHSTMYVNLKDGRRTLELDEPSMIDYGIKKIHMPTGSYRNAYITLHGGEKRVIKWGETMEGDRIMAKAMFLDKEGQYKFPNLVDLPLDENIVLHETLYLAKSAKNPSQQAREMLVPTSVSYDMPHYADKIVQAKMRKFNSMVDEDGASFDRIRQKLGVEDSIHLLDEEPKDWLTLHKLDFSPEWVRAKVRPSTFSLDRQQAVLWDRSAYEQLETFAKQTAYEQLGMSAEAMPHIVDGVVAAAATTGATLLRSATSVGKYLGMEQAMTTVGNLVHNITRSQYTEARKAMDVVFAEMKTDKKAVADFVHAKTWMEGTAGDVHLMELPDGTTILAKGKTIDKMDLGGDIPINAIEGEDFIRFTEAKAVEWAKQWAKTLQPMAVSKKRLLQAEGYRPTYDPDAFYLPPSAIKFGAFVYHKNGVGGNTKVGLLRANTAKELRNSIARYESKNPDHLVQNIGDIEDFYNAVGQFDISKQFSLAIDKDLKSKGGKALTLNPSLNADELILELDAHLMATVSKNNRRAVRLAYSKPVSVLENLHQRQSALARSGSKEVVDRYAIQNTSASRAIKTMLDIPQDQGIAFLSEANKSVEKHISKIHNEFKQWLLEVRGKHTKNILGDKPTKTLAELQDKFSDLGGVDFSSVNDVLIASRPDVNKKVLQKFLSQVNGYSASLMLRADGLDGLVNNLSATILGSTEFKAIMADLPEAAQKRVAKLVTLDGGEAATKELSAINSVLSGMRLIANAPKRKAFIEKWKGRHMWEAQDEMFENISHEIDDAFRGNMKGLPKTIKKIDKMWGKVKNVAFFASDKLNDHAQLQILHLIDNIAEAGGLTEAQTISLAATMKSRVLGATIPSQKPTLFHGAIGTPLGLYQNYNLNVLNAMLRYAGDKGQATRFAVLQSGIFGVQGLPGFEQLNHAVAEIHGKEEGADLRSIIDDTMGTRAHKWLLYGGVSNVIDGALYTRGDLNPRNKFIFLPSKVDDIPAVSFVKGIMGVPIGTMQDVAAGAGFGSAFWDNVAHSGINRPLTGIIDAYRGYSTTKYGGLAQNTEDEHIYSQDQSHALFWRADVARILGARPLDEAIVRERVYRLSSYQRDAQNTLNRLGATINKELLAKGGKLDQDTVDRFMVQFMRSGKTATDFEKWFKYKVKHYKQDQINTLEKRVKKSKYYATYQQYFAR